MSSEQPPANPPPPAAPPPPDAPPPSPERFPPRGPGGAKKVLLPLLIFLGVSAIVFGLAKAQLFEKEIVVPDAGTPVALGDAANGAQLFSSTCAGCHGASGEGGIGPALQDNPITLAEAQAVIQQGRGGMPAGLVSGTDEADVLAHLATLLRDGGGVPPAGNPDAGEVAFAQTCSGCHGDAGAGGSGPRLQGATLTAEQVLGIIASGRGVMPAGLAEGQTAQDIAAYLTQRVFAGATPPPPPPPVTAPPPPPTAPPPPVTAPPATGDPVAGAETFAATCAGCHGDGATGGIGPALVDTTLSQDQLRQVITNGRGGMPAGLVAGADLENVVAYIGTLGATPEPGGLPGGTASFTGPALDRVRVDLAEPAPADWTVTLIGPGGRAENVLSIAAGEDSATSEPLGRGTLVEQFEGVEIGPSPDLVRLQGALTPQIAGALRLLLVSTPDTPEQIALVAGGTAAMQPFERYAGEIVDALAAGNLTLAKTNAEALVNTIRGAPGSDLDGDGAVLTPGDGFGLLGIDQPGYVPAERAAVQVIASDPGLTPLGERQVTLADGAARATARFLGNVVAAARRIAAATSLAGARTDGDLIDALDGRIVAGQERVVEYVPGIAQMFLRTPAGG